MSKLPKTDFKALIAGQVAPTAIPEPEPPPPVEPPAPQAPPPVREVVTFKSPRPAAPVQRTVGEGTLKQRANQLSVYLEPQVYDALRDIAHVERTKMHPLVLEGIDMVLKKRGSPSIKELTKKVI